VKRLDSRLRGNDKKREKIGFVFALYALRFTPHGFNERNERHKRN